MLSVMLLSTQNGLGQQKTLEEITDVLESWHQAAADADFQEYFEKMAEASVFIGTDPSENWNKNEFMEWSRPYFDKGKAWSFTTIDRNIYFSESCPEFAWFDELLQTQMGICRGSGVVTLERGNWKIKHYVLSITIPNEKVSEVTDLKKELDQRFLSDFSLD